jgi:hypothetical protein
MTNDVDASTVVTHYLNTINIGVTRVGVTISSDGGAEFTVDNFSVSRFSVSAKECIP